MSKLQEVFNNYLNENVDDVSVLEKELRIKFKQNKSDYVATLRPKDSHDFWYIAGNMGTLLKRLGFNEISAGRTDNSFTYKKGAFTMLIIEITKSNQFRFTYSNQS